MSLVETLQAAHKARVARIAARAIAPAQKPIARPAAPEPAAAPEPVSPPLAVLDYTTPGGPVRISRILRIVADHFEVAPSDLISSRRTAHLIFPRHIVYCLCKQLTLHSLPVIGRSLGGRNHATILYGVRKIERQLAADTELRALVDELIRRIGGSDQSDKRLPRQRLTEDKVREIRASDEGIVELARRYGVTHGAIWCIRNYRTWAHVK